MCCGWDFMNILPQLSKFFVFYATHRLNIRFSMLFFLAILLSISLSREWCKELFIIVVVLSVFVLVLFCIENYCHHIYVKDRKFNKFSNTSIYALKIIFFYLIFFASIYFVLIESSVLLVMFSFFSLFFFTPLLAKKVGEQKKYIISYHGLALWAKRTKKHNVIRDIFLGCDVLDDSMAREFYDLASDRGYKVWLSNSNPMFGAMSLNEDVIQGIYRSKMYVLYISEIMMLDVRGEKIIGEALKMCEHCGKCIILVYSRSSDLDLFERKFFVQHKKYLTISRETKKIMTLVEDNILFCEKLCRT